MNHLKPLGEPSPARARQRVKAQVLKAGRMPQLPTEDIKIVIRPQGALHIAKIGKPVVTAAILPAVNLTDEESLEDTVCPNTQQKHSGREHTSPGACRPTKTVPLVIRPRTSSASASGNDRQPPKPSINKPAPPHKPRTSSPSRNPGQGEPTRLQNSISVEGTPLKIPVCIGITQQIYQRKQDNTEIAQLKRENATLRDPLTKLTKEVRDLNNPKHQCILLPLRTPLPLVRRPFRLPPPRKEPCKMEPRAKSVLRLRTCSYRSKRRCVLSDMHSIPFSTPSRALFNGLPTWKIIFLRLLAMPPPVCDPSGAPMATSTISHHGPP
ncbi:hypothetical protein MTO96_040266 [Rhipicephalus appendiculatus]